MADPASRGPDGSASGIRALLPTARLRRSLRLRLTLAFVAVTVVAVAAIALQVLPSLESSLAQQRLQSLDRDTSSAVADVAPAGGRPRSDRAVVAAVAARTGADVLLVAEDGAGAVRVVRDSAGTGSSDPAALRLARRSLEDRDDARAVDDGDRLRARVAIASPGRTSTGERRAVVATEDLADVRATVSFVRRRVVLGGILGLVVAVLTGTAFAVGVSTRLRRLQDGSREVAAGRFATRFDVDAPDELGALARSLDTMQHQLKELDSSRKRFIATASHELRTPLQSLSGFVELLQDEELDEEERRAFLEQLATQVRRLTRLSYDLLDLSKLESGGLDLRPEMTDLHDLARQVAQEFVPRAEREGRRLTVRLAGDPVEHWCDPERVAQIVRILVDNAFKHSGTTDEVIVRVSRGGGAARIQVTDHGTGISAEDLPRVFEPFHGTGDGSGAGLGLAIARELAHRMRGTLGVEAGGSGITTTTFTLELPA
ncbi:sensor histidine kinase [Patulibacter minatonensis]|uniref:sensor histidine kinase n=1 Tax=Patulibacter minatonensis TaxID=298163 RepID=UPI00047DF4F9|nr:HAMP domain-containing sensor histidine kinase [Patulibacter minatonensis]